MCPQIITISVIILWIWNFLVSGFLTDVTQQIHSLRASDVRSFHASFAFAAFMSDVRKSAGVLCTTPVEIFVLVIKFESVLTAYRYVTLRILQIA